MDDLDTIQFILNSNDPIALLNLARTIGERAEKNLTTLTHLIDNFLNKENKDHEAKS
jgi:cob(I)alamin adenosyltransferase